MEISPPPLPKFSMISFERRTEEKPRQRDRQRPHHVLNETNPLACAIMRFTALRTIDFGGKGLLLMHDSGIAQEGQGK